jgi:hypothetical protein
MTNITVSLRGNKVVCDPDNGDAWVTAGTITWQPGNNVARFKLDFYKKQMQGNGATSNWPFHPERPDPPGSSSTGWQTQFTGTVKQEAGVYDYTVEAERVGGVAEQGETYFLDPMIIVGRG